MQKRFVLILVIILSIFAVNAYADIAPRLYGSASMDFFITQNNQSIKNNFRTDIIACRQDGCTHPDNSAECTNSSCHFYYYRIERIPQKMKLQVTLKDKIYTSDMFGFSSSKSPRKNYYIVNIDTSGKMKILKDDTLINQYEENTPIKDLTGSEGYTKTLTSFGYAAAVTILLELAVLIIFLKQWKIKKWKKPILTIIIANLISIPLVWTTLLVILAAIHNLLAILIAESAAIIFEAYFIYLLNKKIIPLKKAFILSTAMNMVSLIIGGLILISLV